MAQQVQFRRGTTTEISSFVGVEGEVVVDTTKDVLVVMDGSTSGGFPVAARANADGTISLIKKDGTSAGSINSAGLFNNTLTSTNTDQALTAAQGKVLNDVKLSLTSAFGINQANIITSRSADTTYTNTTTKTRIVMVTSSGGNSVNITGYTNGVAIVTAETSSSFGGTVSITFPVSSGENYKVTGSFTRWVEYT